MSQSLKAKLAPFASDDFASIWNDAIYAMRVVNRYAHNEHYWHRLMRDTHKLHPVIHRMVHEFGVRPLDWQRLLLEWPHISTVDDSQIAYTRSEENGRDFMENGDKRQTRVSVGKYLARHYAHLPAHLLRDIALLYQPADYEIWTTKEDIISGIELGPQSCMKSSYGSVPFNNRDNERLLAYRAGGDINDVRWDAHPYAVYAPEYGWAMAVRIDKGQPDIVLGRALVYTDPDNPTRKVYVRSYMRVDGSSYSESDHKLEAWLGEQGYQRESAWPDGARLRYIEHPRQDGPLLPYIDGGVQRVSHENTYFVIDEDGNYLCTNTDGTADGVDRIGTCEDCDDDVSEGDDHIYAGRYEDRLICSCCRDNYRWVIGRRSTYYVHEDDAIRVSGEWYDNDNLPDCIVYVESIEEHRHIDDVVRCETDNEYYEPDDEDIVEIDGNWYRRDDSDVVQCADDEYRLKSDCWECQHSGNWYSDDEDGVELDAGKYHPDSLHELADNA